MESDFLLYFLLYNIVPTNLPDTVIAEPIRQHDQIGTAKAF